ncbi:MAG: sensor histidine kinase [Rhodospirillales bacterium]|nr:sensor histidine kinase [Rhodospirillales bacterium]
MLGSKGVRVLFLSGTALILTLITGATFIIWQFHDQVLADVRRNMEQFTVVLSEQTMRAIQGADLVLRATVERYRPDSGGEGADGAAMHRILRERIAGMSHIDAVTIVGTDGTVTYSSRAWPTPPVNIADRLFFQRQRIGDAKAIEISEPVLNRVTGRWSIVLSRRLPSDDGRFAGLAVAVIDVGYFRDLYRSIHLGEGSRIGLFKSDGALLYLHPGDEEMFVDSGKGAAPWQTLLTLATDGIAVLKNPADGLPTLVAAKRISSYPLTIMVTFEERAALSSWRKKSLLIAGSTGAAVVAVAFLIGLLARQLRREQRLVRRAREAARLADAANRAKDKFLAAMSHEFRTPLNAILGFSETLEKGYWGALNDRQRGYASDIYAAGRHLLSLVDDVLDFSRIDVGEVHLNEQHVQIATVIERCHSMVKEQAAARGVDIRKESNGALPLIKADERLLTQAVLNVLGNAVKFTGPGGRVTVSVPTGENGIAIVVEDTGIGIAAADLIQIYEPFRRGDINVTRRHDGFGLGLAITKGLIELHGGAIAIESKVGLGTRVTLALPRERVVSR